MHHISQRLVFALVLLLGITASSCAQRKDSMNQSSPSQRTAASRVLVTYFSATGTTAAVAQKIAEVTGGTLRAIRPERDYTASDLDWQNDHSRSSVEMKDPSSRPALAADNSPLPIARYDTIFIGYPIWWDLAPRVVNTFIEAHDLRGKVLIPFATSGSSSIDNSVRELRRTYPDLDWHDGRLLNGASERTIRSWIEAIRS